MASPEYPSGELVSTQLPGHRVGPCSLEACPYPGRIRSGWRAARQRGPFLRGHRVGSSMPDDSLRSHARWSLRAVLLDIMPRQLAHAGAFLCCPHASPFGTGPKGAKARPLSLPTGAKESGAKKSPGRPRRSTATMRPCCAGTCPYLRRSAQRAEASGCGHEPDDFVPFEARPARRASPFELRGRAQKVRFTPRYPLPSPAGETSFYPASAIKGAKPRPLSLS